MHQHTLSTSKQMQMREHAPHTFTRVAFRLMMCGNFKWLAVSDARKVFNAIHLLHAFITTKWISPSSGRASGATCLGVGGCQAVKERLDC
jgi:hypothetical protein